MEGDSVKLSFDKTFEKNVGLGKSFSQISSKQECYSQGVIDQCGDASPLES